MNKFLSGRRFILFLLISISQYNVAAAEEISLPKADPVVLTIEKKTKSIFYTINSKPIRQDILLELSHTIPKSDNPSKFSKFLKLFVLFQENLSIEDLTNFQGVALKAGYTKDNIEYFAFDKNKTYLQKISIHHYFKFTDDVEKLNNAENSGDTIPNY